MWHSLKVTLGISTPSASAELAAVIWALASAITRALGGGLGALRICQRDSDLRASGCRTIAAGFNHQSHEEMREMISSLVGNETIL